MKPRHIIIGLCMALLMAPSALGGTDLEAASNHICSGDMDFDCIHPECTQIMCTHLHCPIYVGHSEHVVPVVSCVPT